MTSRTRITAPCRRQLPFLALLGILVGAGVACTKVVYVNGRPPDGGAGGGGGGGLGLCAPCETHADCGGADDYCLRNNQTGEVFCAVSCTDGACPDGYTCFDLSGAGVDVPQCIPTAGSCADAPAPAPGCDPACGADEVCQDGTCVPTDGCSPACGADEVCQDGTCVPTDGCSPPCPAGQLCQAGQCVTPEPYEAELQHCVDVINQYRASNGKAPLSRSKVIEAYASQGAEYDAAHRSPHGHFMTTSGGGVAWAENEIPGWDMSFGDGSVMGVIEEGLEMMWEEGPGGGHYQNMNGSYTQVGCGIFVTSDGEVWVTQDFA